ncbi:MAG: glycosyltransferase, partial [Gammaproteobacteria bacterium]
MAKISACIISFNEEKKVEDCLKSLQPIVDEIIIVDSLSSDNTLKIA